MSSLRSATCRGVAVVETARARNERSAMKNCIAHKIEKLENAAAAVGVNGIGGHWHATWTYKGRNERPEELRDCHVECRIVG